MYLICNQSINQSINLSTHQSIALSAHPVCLCLPDSLSCCMAFCLFLSFFLSFFLLSFSLFWFSVYLSGRQLVVGCSISRFLRRLVSRSVNRPALDQSVCSLGKLLVRRSISRLFGRSVFGQWIVQSVGCSVSHSVLSQSTLHIHLLCLHKKLF